VDLDRLDPAFFDRLRSRVVAARDRGLYVGIMLFSPDSGAKREDWGDLLFNPANNVQGINADNPAKGATASSGRIESSGKAQQFRAPFEADAVLYLQAQSKQEPITTTSMNRVHHVNQPIPRPAKTPTLVWLGLSALSAHAAERQGVHDEVLRGTAGIRCT